jgi:hypothetical protein
VNPESPVENLQARLHYWPSLPKYAFKSENISASSYTPILQYYNAFSMVSLDGVAT